MKQHTMIFETNNKTYVKNIDDGRLRDLQVEFLRDTYGVSKDTAKRMISDLELHDLDYDLINEIDKDYLYFYFENEIEA